MQDDETFSQQAQRLGEGLRNLTQRINFVRQKLRGRALMMRELAIRPAVDAWGENRPRPLGLLARASMQPEYGAKQLEPILPITAGVTETKLEVGVVEKPAESEPPRWSRYKNPDQPALL